MVGRWASGKPHPTLQGCKVGCFPCACQTEPTEPQRGNGAGVATSQPLAQVSPCPSPGSGIKPLGGTLEGIRCSAYAISASAGNRAGRTSLRSSPHAVDVQSNVQSWRGCGKITATSDQAFTRIFQLFCSRKPLTLAGVGGFRISRHLKRKRAVMLPDGGAAERVFFCLR